MTLGTGVRALGVVALLIAAADPALAKALLPVAEQMAQARLAEQGLDYDVAADLWQTLVSRQDLTAAQRFEANLNAGRVNRILGRDTEARMNFLYVLRQQPGHQLPPGTPPKVADFFELVRQEVQATARQGADGRAGNGQTQPASPVVVPARPAAGASAPPASGLGWPLLIGGGALAIGGLAALAVGGVSAVQFGESERRATATDEQVERAAIYDERDRWAWAANIGLAGGALLAIGGATLVAVGLVWSGE